MSQALKSALDRVRHELDLDRARERLNIPVDVEVHARLVARYAQLNAQLAQERAEEMQILGEQSRKSKREELPWLTPMGMDETMSECEDRVNFGEPLRKLPKSI